MKKKFNIEVFGPTYIDREIYLCGNISLDGSAEIESEKVFPGGTGLCYSIALAHLGNIVTTNSVIGSDTQSNLIRNSILKEKNLSPNFQTVEGKTDFAILLIDKGSHKVAASQKIISNFFDIKYLDSTPMEQADAFVISSFENTVTDNILSFVETIKKPFVMWAPHKKNCEEIHILRSHLHLIDHITLSQEEYNIMRKILNPLNYGVKSITVTKGFEGVTLITKNYLREFEAFESLENPVDTNGAGEAFGAGFLTSYLAEHDLEKGVHAGQYVAYLHIQNEGPDFPRIKTKEINNAIAHKLCTKRNLDYNIFNEK